MSGPAVTVEWHAEVGCLRFANPGRRNALSGALLDAMLEGLASLAGARAVVLRSATPGPVWCAGFDINELRPGWDVLAPEGRLRRLFRAITDFPAPVIAMLDGTAWGGGADLALRCDWAIATPAAGLAFTPARIGLAYDPDGLRNVMLRAGLAAALEMFATGDLVPAPRALALGLINHVVPGAEIERFTMEMAARIAANAPLAVAAAKRQLRRLAEGVALPDEEAARSTALDSADYAEGLAAFAARRRPKFEGR